MALEEVNYCFHYSEKLKSNFFLVAGVVDGLVGQDGERLEGGRNSPECSVSLEKGVKYEIQRYPHLQGYVPV